ncbi:hypothetical protein GCM10022140_22900 [Rhodococcus aetherivorans]|uniref:hypothetical protein n=1 Tax=Rhodococcus aetherivorans TaxID=191292 RepID=UPI0012611B79|nr:hypothetical protein [Rhodococcus aetherivorans]MDV6295202.1 hypothetical protein [Rhodococcus aetherivorans]NGP28484.1 hypothetical protein [Rhodococcus aetherivorans]
MLRKRAGGDEVIAFMESAGFKLTVNPPYNTYGLWAKESEPQMTEGLPQAIFMYGLINQEAEAHATKHLLDLIGPNEPVDGFSKDPNRSVRPAARNEVRDELRAKIEAWAGGES